MRGPLTVVVLAASLAACSSGGSAGKSSAANTAVNTAASPPATSRSAPVSSANGSSAPPADGAVPLGFDPCAAGGGLHLSALVGFPVTDKGAPYSGGADGVQQKGCTFYEPATSGTPGNVNITAYGGASRAVIVKSLKGFGAKVTELSAAGLPAGSFVTDTSGFKLVVVIDDKPFSVSVTPSPTSSAPSAVDGAIKVAQALVTAR